MRPSYCLEISYSGTDFFGWQSQPHGNTVQDCIETQLAKLLGERVRLIPASRTDSGVHAQQQFAVFRSQLPITFSKDFLFNLNESLPDSIDVKSVKTASPTFHPCHDAKQKLYCYRIILDSRPNSRNYPNHWRVFGQIDTEMLTSELSSLVGTFDFTSFCAGDSSVKNKIRTISEIEVKKQDEKNTIEIWFRGPAFLKQMIRIIVGSAVSYARNEPHAEPLLTILAKKTRLAAGKTAPAQGLTLTQIFY